MVNNCIGGISTHLICFVDWHFLYLVTFHLVIVAHTCYLSWISHSNRTLASAYTVSEYLLIIQLVSATYCSTGSSKTATALTSHAASAKHMHVFTFIHLTIHSCPINLWLSSK
jgi:hypothetical protein